MWSLQKEQKEKEAMEAQPLPPAAEVSIGSPCLSTEPLAMPPTTAHSCCARLACRYQRHRRRIHRTLL